MKKILSYALTAIFAVSSLNIQCLNVLAETEKVDGEKYGLIFEEDFEAYNDGDNVVSVSNGVWTQEKPAWNASELVMEDPTGEKGGMVYASKNQKQTGVIRHALPEGKYKIEAKMYDPGASNKATIAIFAAPLGSTFNNYIGIQAVAGKNGDQFYNVRMNSSTHLSTEIERSMGWKTVGIDFLSDSDKVIYYVENETIETLDSTVKADAVAIGTIWENSAASAPDVYFDDIKVYGSIPYVEGLYPTIIGTGITAEYTYDYANEDKAAEGETIYKWYVSDSEDGEYTEVDGETEKIFSPDIDKDDTVWVKVEVTPVSSDGTTTGMPTMSNAIAFSGNILDSMPVTTYVNINTDSDGVYVGTEYTASWDYTSPVGNEQGETEVWWQVSDNGVDGFEDIEGADSAYFTPQKEQRGKCVRACVKPIDSVGILGESVYSDAYKVVTDAVYYTEFNAALDVKSARSIIEAFADEKEGYEIYNLLPAFDTDFIVPILMDKAPFNSDDELGTALSETISATMSDNTENKYNIVLHEDFEGEKIAFTPVSGSVKVDNTNCLSGDKASHFYGNSKSTHQLALDGTGYYKYVVYVYDDIAATAPQIALQPKLGGSSNIAVGLSGNHKTSYHYRLGGTSGKWIDSTVKRTTGWHKFVIDFTEETGVKIYIDKTLVYNGSTDTANEDNEWLYKTDALEVGNFWGNLTDGNKITVDDVIVEKKAGPYASDITLTQDKKLLNLDYEIINPWGTGEDSNPVASFEWYRSDTQNGTYTLIDGAKDSTYEVTATDVGKWIYAKILVSDNGVDGVTKTSPIICENYMANVAPKVTNVAISEAPTVSKTVKVTFDLTKGEFDIDESKTVYKWYVSEIKDGEYVELTDNTTAEYKSDIANAGRYIKASVTACDTDGNYGSEVISTPVYDETTLDDILVRVSEGKTSNGDVLKALERFSDEFAALKTAQKESVVLKVLKQKCKDAETLEDIIEEVVNKKTSSGGGGGGGGGGGSSLSSNAVGVSTGFINTQVNYVPETDNNNYEEEVISFTDLDKASWAEEAIMELTKRGIITGRGNGVFDPTAPITREEFVAIMMRIFGWTSKNTTSFTDADQNEWYAKVLAAAEEKNVINGISENTFGIGLNITREDMTVIAHRCLVKSGNIIPNYGEDKEFADYDVISDYAKDSVMDLANANVVNGDEGMFSPKDTATRAMVAQIAYNMLELIKE